MLSTGRHVKWQHATNLTPRWRRVLTQAQRTALTSALPSWSGIQWRPAAQRSAWAQNFLLELDHFRAITSTAILAHYQQRQKQIIRAVGLGTEPYDLHVRGL